MNVNLKSLIATLNDTSRSALEGAAGLCLARTNYDVDIEHLLIKLAEPGDTDLARVIRHFGIDHARLTSDLTRALDRLKTGNARTPALSPRLPRLIERAWLLASVDYAAEKVRSGHLLLALLTDDDLARLARETSRQFDKVSAEELRKSLPEITSGSAEDRQTASLSGQPADHGA
ncbi:MAG TPA: Clp protease N-terminal domain-containing protein, partial [Blastocatellia bacterium]|nr:Clp protease N-terminal domain-containing protein [Blastocatellia bacterium]